MLSAAPATDSASQQGSNTNPSWLLQVSSLGQELGELRDVKEVTQVAISSLEATLSRMERAEGRQGGSRAGTPAAAARRGRSASSSRWARGDGHELAGKRPLHALPAACMPQEPCSNHMPWRA